MCTPKATPVQYCSCSRFTPPIVGLSTSSWLGAPTRITRVPRSGGHANAKAVLSYHYFNNKIVFALQYSLLRRVGLTICQIHKSPCQMNILNQYNEYMDQTTTRNGSTAPMDQIQIRQVLISECNIGAVHQQNIWGD